MGRRPCRSLRRPQNGAATSWHSEYTPKIGVMSAGEVPNRSAMYGRSGMMMPKPRKSMTTTKKSARHQ